ncbi:MAG: hypothetical protein H6702_09770 [Myxococcales bacterium]|nr:hypothetical protein [Myxococcales bacterium]
MRTLLTALLGLQLAAAAGIGWLIVDRQGAAQATAAQVARADAHAQAAQAHEAAHRFVEAQLAYERATRLAGHLPQAEGWLDGARRCLALATVQRPDAPGPAEQRPLAGVAAALRAAGDTVVADALDIALLRGRGLIGGAFEKAEAAKAAQDRPHGVWIRWQHATLLMHADRFAEAIEQLEKVVQAAPEFADGFHRLGLAYLGAERPEAGISALQRALAKGAGPEASRDLARAFLGRQMWAEATTHLETVLRGDPGDAEALRLLGAAHYQLKRYRLAADTYRKAWRLEPQPRTLISAVIALQGAQAWAEALAIIEEIRPQAERLPEIAFHEAVLKERLSRPADAKAAYQGYLALAAGHPDEAKRVATAQKRLVELALDK